MKHRSARIDLAFALSARIPLRMFILDFVRSGDAADNPSTLAGFLLSYLAMVDGCAKALRVSALSLAEERAEGLGLAILRANPLGREFRHVRPSIRRLYDHLLTFSPDGNGHDTGCR